VIAILTRSHTLSSFAIRARLGERWSHALVPLSPVQCVDSTFKAGGVRKRLMTEAMANASARLYLHLPLDREIEAQDWLESQVGKGYDWRAIYGFAGGAREWNDDFAWFCFELVAAQIEIGSEFRFPNRNRVTGADLIKASRILKGEAV
jgi:uncharacterized protein YycO